LLTQRDHIRRLCKLLVASAAFALFSIVVEARSQNPTGVDPVTLLKRVQEQEPRRSIAGKSIASWWMIPEMKETHEIKLVAALKSRAPESWKEVKLSQICEHVSKQFPREINTNALESINSQIMIIFGKIRKKCCTERMGA